jgi:hypothetical protein
MPNAIVKINACVHLPCIPDDVSASRNCARSHGSRGLYDLGCCDSNRPAFSGRQIVLSFWILGEKPSPHKFYYFMRALGVADYSWRVGLSSSPQDPLRGRCMLESLYFAYHIRSLLHEIATGLLFSCERTARKVRAELWIWVHVDGNDRCDFEFD